MFRNTFLIMFVFSSASSPNKNPEAKSNDILAMISPEGERVGLGKVAQFDNAFFLHKTLYYKNECMQMKRR